MSAITTSETIKSISPVEQEKFLLGYIDGYTRLDPVELGIDEYHKPLSIWNVAIDDPYVSTRPAAERLEVKNAEFIADNFARERRLKGYWERRPGTAYVTEEGVEQEKAQWGDPEARERFFGKVIGSRALQLWQSELIPSAKALAYLSDPDGFETVESADGSHTEPMDDITRKWFSLCTDAIGIRSRATVMSAAIEDYVKVLKAEPEHHSADNLHWMSIACGTALPTIKAATAAKLAPELLLVDWDVNAMKQTHELAKELNFEGNIETRRANIFAEKDMKKLRDQLRQEDKLPDVIDLMGIFEYTGKNIGVDPVVFLRSAYDFLKPGGRLIFGQMRSDRPLPDFTMGVVSWPHVHMRTPTEVMEIVRNAGILPEQTRLFLPEDGVYTVGVIDKPIVH